MIENSKQDRLDKLFDAFQAELWNGKYGYADDIGSLSFADGFEQLAKDVAKCVGVRALT